MFNLELLKQELVSSNGLRSVFTLITVATILTIYEFVVFYYVIVPTVKSKIASALDSGGEALRGTLYKSIGVSNQEQNLIRATQEYSQTEQEIESIVQVFKDREDVKLDKINKYTIATGALILGGLASVLYIIKHTLNSRGTTIGICTWITIGATVALLAIFQYNFYLYGNKYKYLGSAGNEELIAFLYTNMDTSMKSRTETRNSQQPSTTRAQVDSIENQLKQRADIQQEQEQPAIQDFLKSLEGMTISEQA